MENKLNYRIIAIIIIIVGLIYLSWGIFWFISYMIPGRIWYTMIPDIYLIKDMVIGGILISYGYYLLRKKDEHKLLFQLIIKGIPIYLFVLIITQLFIWKEIYYIFFLFDLLVPILIFLSSKFIIGNYDKHSNFSNKVLIIYILIYIMIPFVISLILSLKYLYI